MKTHENIKLLREKKGLSQEELALKVGYKDRSSIAKIEAGLVDLAQSKIAAFASALAVTPAQLMGIADTDNPELTQSTIPQSPLFQPLPRMKEWKVLGGTACGDPLHMELEETITAPVDIDADYVFRCVGDSMIGARILDGDIVFVKTGDVENGQIGVVRVEDAYSLKRIYHGEDYLELRSENPMHPPIILRGEQINAEIIGKAVCFQSRVI